MNPVKIQSTQGQIAAVIHLAATPSGKLAILCPGFLDSKDYNHLTILAQDLSILGFDAVRFDPIGTWESEGDISKYTSTQYLEDIKVVLEYMLGKGEYKDIVLVGHSRGGQVAILYAARDPRITQVVAIMPSSSLVFNKEVDDKWKLDGVKTSTRDIPGQSSTREYVVPYSHSIDKSKYDSLVDIQKVHVPVLILSGELDRVVLPEYVEAIYKNANEPKKYILLKNIGHDYRKDVDTVREVNKLIIQEMH